MTKPVRPRCPIDQDIGTVPQALTCKKELEEKTGEPYHVDFVFEDEDPLRPSPPSVFVMKGVMPRCAEGMVYEELIRLTSLIPNELKARQCAESLAMLHKRPFKAEKVNGGIFSSGWKVIAETKK